MSEVCGHCGQELPCWIDIASELESMVLPAIAIPTNRQMMRQAITQLRERDQQVITLTNQLIDARTEAERIRRERPPLSFEVVDVGTPGVHYNKQVIHAYPVSPVHWRVEIK
jgi:hypothetical protein